MVRLHNGTFHHVNLIEGDESYKALMRRASLRQMTCLPYNFGSYWGQLQYQASCALRLLNKFFGRPANQDIAILASMVSRLLGATQTWLGDKSPISGVVLSTPTDSNLYSGEINDIFDYLKLECLTHKYLSGYLFGAAKASYADYGKGLCHN